MRKLANIVVNGKRNTFGNIYNVTGSCEGVDSSLPTLYIGVETARKCIDGFNILKKHYPEQRCWWTFSKNERRDDHDNDIRKFQEDVMLDALSGVRYEYVDFISYTGRRLKRFIRYVMSDSDKICFVTKGMNFVFIYDVSLGCVFGLSLALCEYCGVDSRKVLGRIRKNRRNRFIRDTSFLTDDARKIIGDNTHYILPLYDYFAE